MTAYAQNKSPEAAIDRLVEELFQTSDPSANEEDLHETLYQLYANPISLNQTSRDELSRLHLLSTMQINALLDYLDAYGPLLSIYELQVIAGFDLSTIRAVLPFIKVNPPEDYPMKGLTKRIFNEHNNHFILRMEQVLERQKGYDLADKGYLGSPQRLYGQFRVRHVNDFSLGLTFEKDAGERIVIHPAQSQYGFDYYSFHLLLENKGRFKKLVLGDYEMQFGQGLVLGYRFNFGKRAETITTVKRVNAGLKPYTSVLESGFMRGVGFTYGLGDFDITPFYSQTKRDAVVRTNSPAAQGERYISGIQTTGKHRTRSELNAKENVTEETLGMNVTFSERKHNKLQAGMTFIHSQFSLPTQKSLRRYNLFDFRGRQNYNLGLFVNYHWENIQLFVEAAKARAGGTAVVGGCIGSLSPAVSMSLLYRSYSQNYHAFYGHAFGETRRTTNESGIYWGIKFTPSRKISISGYYDAFQFPWLRLGVDAPSKGYEYLLSATYRPSKKIKIYALFRQESKQESIRIKGENLSTLITRVKHVYIGNLDCRVNDQIGLRSRIQFSTISRHQNTSGMTIIQDLNLHLSPIIISARVALFDTDDYDNRQYAFEKNPLYTFSIPAYWGKGIRNYLMVQYKPTRKLHLWLRYGRFVHHNMPSIGSGLDENQGNIRSDMKLQVRYKF